MQKQWYVKCCTLGWIKAAASICTTVIIFFITIQSQFQKMPGFTKDILFKRVNRIDFYQIFHHENTWFFNICVIKLKYAYSTLLLNIYKETDKQKHQYNCLSWTGCFFFFINTVFSWINNRKTNFYYSDIYICIWQIFSQKLMKWARPFKENTESICYKWIHSSY